MSGMYFVEVLVSVRYGVFVEEEDCQGNIDEALEVAVDDIKSSLLDQKFIEEGKGDIVTTDGLGGIVSIKGLSVSKASE